MFELRKSEVIRIYVRQDADSAVRIAAEQLCKDLKATMGINANLTEEMNGSRIRIFQDGEDPDAATYLKDETGKDRWEAYVLYCKDDVLYLEGNGRRGAVYAIYELSEKLGVSPWYDWGDLPIHKRDLFTLPDHFCDCSYPSVQYRGIFLNDEEELDAWAKEHTADDTIGPETYRKIYELILRLKGNYLWPAMHVNYFNENPENARLAHEMGIIVGTSHCEMLLRSNQNEWKPWIAKKGYWDLQYDYSVSDEAREKLREYWRERVDENRAYESSYTVGMRGIHDTGFVAQAIDSLDLSEEEKRSRKVALMEQVISDQRMILQESLGRKKEEILQLFIPYKEVLPLYDSGMKLPEDITVMWVDDNFGYMRRYPSEEEQKRPGGHALYYHNSYWAHPGMSYLFINTIPMAQTGWELQKCYEQNIRKIWVLNVGALKPLEQDLSYFMACAWDAGREESVTKDPDRFLRSWIDASFHGGIGGRLTDLYQRFTQSVNVCKVEHLRSDLFSQTSYGDEAGARLRVLYDLFAQVAQMEGELPEEERAAFFQMFTMKFAAAFYKNAEFYYADRSRLCMRQGKYASIDTYAALAEQMRDQMRYLLYYYNRMLSGGKWDRILTPEAFPPPGFPMYPNAARALKIGDPGVLVTLWGDRKELIFESGGVMTKWLEIANPGCGCVDFQLSLSCSEGLSLSEQSGELTGEKRILITCAKEALLYDHQELLTVTSVAGNARIQIPILLRAGTDGYVLIPAEKYEERGMDGDPWHVIPHLGRMCGSLVCAGKAPVRRTATYHFQLCSSGSFEIELSRYLTLSSTGQIRFTLQIDQETPILLSSETLDEWRGNWREAVLNDGEKLCAQLPMLSPGVHTLTVSSEDPYVAFDRIVIYTAQKRAHMLLPDLRQISEDPGLCRLPIWQEAQLDLPEILEAKAQISAEKLLPELIYADQSFWTRDLLYCPAQSRPQRLSAPVYLPDATGRKDVCKAFGTGAILEADGVLAW
ncbi:MAG: glycosyl hydrolase 115 family protein, partial [Lachnospiraceae bacterium]|nr:glycosyl hydrolase 115 family protein [Lachnospiraceae bacterium]